MNEWWLWIVLLLSSVLFIKNLTFSLVCIPKTKQKQQFTQEPLIPIGCLTTAYFLGSGIRSFYNRDSIRSQKMMRARVGAQFMTLAFLAGYAGMNAINFEPGNRWKGYKDDERKS